MIIEGAHIGEAKTYAENLVDKEGLTYINGYNDPPIVAGAGTIGVEVSISSFLWCQKEILLKFHFRSSKTSRRLMLLLCLLVELV